MPLAVLAQNTAAVAPAPTVQSSVIVEIQTLLSRLGYDPGPADGVAGQRTLQAILQFERTQQGRPPTGRPTAALLAQLRIAAAPPAPQPDTVIETGPPGDLVPDAPGNPPNDTKPTEAAGTPVLSTILSRWRIRDDSGGTLTVRLHRNGRVGDIANPDYWQWDLAGNQITIIYEDGWGDRIIRRGTVSGTEIVGDAEIGRSDAGIGEAARRKWRWQAIRLPETAGQSPFNAPSSFRPPAPR